MGTTALHDWRAIRAEMRPGEAPHHVANRVLRAFGVSRPAIEVEAIAMGLGAHVARDPSLDCSGMIWHDNARPIIAVKSSEAPVRQRFTIAHEIGHLLLHPPGVEFRDNARFSGGPGEVEANRFAANLLVPLWMLEPIATARKRTVGDLAAIFEVSVASMQFQLDRLG